VQVIEELALKWRTEFTTVAMRLRMMQQRRVCAMPELSSPGTLGTPNDGNVTAAIGSSEFNSLAR